MKSSSIFFILLLLLVASYFAFFLHLASPPLYMWDEARNAVQAVEMKESKNFFVKTYEGSPDTACDTKPPLFIWAVVLSMKIFGINELGLRFPSAIFGLFTAVILFFFSIKYLNLPQTGIISWLVLITSLGFIGEHVARTGDYDAMLVCWVTVYSLFYYLFLNSGDKKNLKKYFLFFILFLTLAAMTKGVASLMFLPGLLMYTIYRKKLLPVLKNPLSYLGIIIFIAMVGAYYFLLEKSTPGYLQYMYRRELSSYNSIIDGHEHPFSFYWNNFFSGSTPEGIGSYPRFLPWIFFLPICSYFILISKNQTVRQMGIFCMVCITAYFFIISFSNTKLIWYDAPVYPFAAIIIGLGLNEIIVLVSDNFDLEKSFVRKAAPWFIIIAIFIFPYVNIFKITYKPKEPGWDQVKYGGFFKNIFYQLPRLKNFTILNPGKNAHLLFYVKTLNLKGYDITLITNPDFTLRENDTIATCSQDVREEIKRKYLCEKFYEDKFCIACKIKGENIMQ